MGNLGINDFTVQVIHTKIGRKELEEFGIVNLPAILNKAHKGARKRLFGNPNEGIWGIVIENYKPLFEDGEQVLRNIKFNNWQRVIAYKSPAIYWIEHIDHGLIGETYDMKKRFKNHSEKPTHQLYDDILEQIYLVLDLLKNTVRKLLLQSRMT